MPLLGCWHMAIDRQAVDLMLSYATLVLPQRAATSRVTGA